MFKKSKTYEFGDFTTDDTGANKVLNIAGGVDIMGDALS